MVRKLALRVFVIGCAAALVAGWTTALYHDAHGATASSAVAGTLDLLIKNNDTMFLDRIPETKPTWSVPSMAPGEYMEYEYSQIRQIDLKNSVGSIAARTVDIGVVNQVDDPPGPASDSEEHTTDMDSMIEIVWMEYENDAVHMVVDPAGPSLLVDANGNGWLDLDDLERSPVTGLHAPTGAGRMQLRTRFRPEADSDYQGDTVVAEFTFTEHQ